MTKRLCKYRVKVTCTLFLAVAGLTASTGFFSLHAASGDDSAASVQAAKREFLETTREEGYDLYAGVIRQTRDAQIKTALEHAEKKRMEKELVAATNNEAEPDAAEEIEIEIEGEIEEEGEAVDFVEDASFEEDSTESLASVESTLDASSVSVASKDTSTVQRKKDNSVDVYVDQHDTEWNLDSGVALLESAVVDSEYDSSPLALTAESRYMFERLVQGEAGSEGFAGAAIVAQSLRDNMRDKGVYDTMQIKSIMAYSGSTRNAPCDDVKRACAFILDEGGMAVQHRVLYFYAPRWVSGHWSSFHERQVFLIEYKGHRVFDRKE